MIAKIFTVLGLASVAVHAAIDFEREAANYQQELENFAEYLEGFGDVAENTTE
jgi:hypothetical protein